MSEGQTLFLVLCLLYLSDCLVWVGKRSVLFSSPWCRRWRTSFGSQYLGNPNGGLAFLNPLPPFGMAFLSHWCPISLSPAGVCALNLETVGDIGGPLQTGSVLMYDEISEVGRDGKSLLLNGSRFAKCATPEQAEVLAQLIYRASRESPENREEVIREFIGERFHKEEALRRLDQVRRLIPQMQWIRLGFFVFLYVLVPVMVVTFGLSRLVIPVAVMMLSTGILISLRFARAHRVIYPLRKSDRVTYVVKMICCPPAAIRAGDFLTLDVMDKFHPVLLSNLFIGAENRAFLRAAVSDLKYPIRHGLDDPKAVSIAVWHTGAHLEACARLLEMEGTTTLNDLLTPPTWDGVSAAYCPRCSCQFTVRSGECPDCPGVKLLPMSQIQTSEAKHE